VISARMATKRVRGSGRERERRISYSEGSGVDILLQLIGEASEFLEGAQLDLAHRLG